MYVYVCVCVCLCVYELMLFVTYKSWGTPLRWTLKHGLRVNRCVPIPDWYTEFRRLPPLRPFVPWVCCTKSQAKRKDLLTEGRWRVPGGTLSSRHDSGKI